MKVHDKNHRLLGGVAFAVAQFQENPAQVCGYKELLENI
jgi:hypothetical protein